MILRIRSEGVDFSLLGSLPFFRSRLSPLLSRAREHERHILVLQVCCVEERIEVVFSSQSSNVYLYLFAKNNGYMTYVCTVIASLGVTEHELQCRNDRNSRGLRAQTLISQVNLIYRTRARRCGLITT